MSRIYFAFFVKDYLASFAFLRYTIGKGGGILDSRRQDKENPHLSRHDTKGMGLAIGFEEKGADNRIAQYETNYRVPKRELLDKMAEALRVDRQNFYTIAPGSAEDFMRTFFWLDEDSPGAIRLFQLVRNPAEQGPLMIPLYGTMIAMTGPHTLPWVCTSSMALWTSSCGKGFFVSRSYTREITREEYFEWKLNWPHTCDDGLKANIISLAEK